MFNLISRVDSHKGQHQEQLFLSSLQIKSLILASLLHEVALPISPQQYWRTEAMKIPQDKICFSSR